MNYLEVANLVIYHGTKTMASTLNLLATCQDLYYRQLTWNVKYQLRYPDFPLFDHWSAEDMYHTRLICEKRDMALCICTSGDNYGVDGFLYEYTGMLENILHMHDEFIHTGIGYSSFDLYKVKIDKRFVVILIGRKNVLEYHDTKEEVKKSLKRYTKVKNCECMNPEEIIIVWIDLSTCTPFFLGKRNKNQHSVPECDFQIKRHMLLKM
jgi:hypothetical protein